MKLKRLLLPTFLLALLGLFAGSCAKKSPEEATAPRIVNIINFVRAIEPRDEQITDDVLFQTVEQQILYMKEYNLKGTFLLQYDALIIPRYQALMKEVLPADCEVGGWWEITQPHAEAAGIKWRGRFPWDWHADVGFSTGYTPKEREMLVDVYMDSFKSIFGHYPASVGSWFIDSHTLGYMYDKYGITASCNCKDQYGTDGYTLWGGYWNQAYYPSRNNAFMPAQTETGQIPVPIFRMLGSDPIYQYDLGLGSSIQGVVSLEPVYGDAGGSKKWVDWFFKTMFTEPCLAFNYVQAGQENSFTWEAMKRGLEIQIPLLAKLRDEGSIRVETLKESGEWFKSNYAVTPATAVTAMTDVREEGRKTVWYNSRFYRANLLWVNDDFRFRDIHLFNEKFESKYLRVPVTSNQCFYTTLPLVDGYLWSTSDCLAGLRVVLIGDDNSVSALPLSNPVVKELSKDVLEVSCQSIDEIVFRIIFNEDNFEVICESSHPNLGWALEMTYGAGRELPFIDITEKEIRATIDNFDYTVSCSTGQFGTLGEAPKCYNRDKNPSAFIILPDINKIVVDCRAK